MHFRIIAREDHAVRAGTKSASNHLRDYQAMSVFCSGLEHVSRIIHIEKIRAQ